MASSYPYYNAGGIPVVQGQAVSAPAVPVPSSNATHGDYQQHQEFHGEKQPNTCKDWIWAVLFYCHLIVVAFATIYSVPKMTADIAADMSGGGYGRRLDEIVTSGSQIFFSWRKLEEQQEEDDVVSLEMSTILVILAVAGCAGLAISTGALTFMMAFPKPLIKASLFFNLVCIGIMGISALAAGAIFLFVMTAIMFMFNVAYTYAVWPRIPFAAANLVTAVSVIRNNMGLVFFAYNNMIVTFLWSIWWAIAFASSTYVLSGCNAEGVCENDVNGFITFLFFLSFYWTAQVIKNVVQCTVAGTTATWWLFPHEANSCCSQGVRDSYWRSITTSFGSICLGSLIVAIIQATRELVNSIRNQDDSNGLLLCIADCILSCLESMAEYFNKWAYVYVGIYGYSFMEASVNVMNLFKSRGWTAIIADVLVDTVLLMVSAGVGLLTGILAVLVATAMGQGATTLFAAFLLGMLVGFVLCSTLFSLVSSAVNAVIVLFAEAPREFQQNYPELSQEMLTAYRSAYPDEFVY
eukprot:CAMPEP_0178743810 /NCGR_PEP_ID=MMETSP0744-20121128/6405_1 /TAXON_ID=913974 /ORGANISM="Nitzschia punctata, Strain CCMP561" /LENGTH=521 /DNA_ID=CAMNT_0020396841 /DNA_START=20 /DNA_END=1585 /DNA_ORIENTATION=-